MAWLAPVAGWAHLQVTVWEALGGVCASLCVLSTLHALRKTNDALAPVAKDKLAGSYNMFTVAFYSTYSTLLLLLMGLPA